MSGDVSLIWIERVLKRIHLPYDFSFLMVAVIVFLIFEFFSTYLKITFLSMDIYHFLQTSAASLLIAYQPIGIHYFLEKMRGEFEYLLPTKESKVFTDSRGHRYPIIVGLITILYIMAQLLYIFLGRNISFYLAQPGPFTLLLDIFNQAVNIFNFFMLSVIFWIYINIVWSLRQIRDIQSQAIIPVDLLDMDKIGGLSGVRRFIMEYFVFYSLSTIISVLSYVTLKMPLSYESIILIVLFLTGVGLFISGLSALEGILTGKIKSEIINISRDNDTQKGNLQGGNSVRWGQRIESVSIMWLNQHKISWLLSQNTSMWNFTSIAAIPLNFLAYFISILYKVPGLWKIIHDNFFIILSSYLHYFW